MIVLSLRRPACEIDLRTKRASDTASRRRLLAAKAVTGSLARRMNPSATFGLAADETSELGS
jgi:hypothetical protein